MTRLSVNVNKVATLRNARGGQIPDLSQVVKDCQRFGADGITVHPRPDERHVRIQDVHDLKPLVYTEFNVEGYPSSEFLDLMEQIRPDQCTLVPDPPEALTSSAGWNTVQHAAFLKDTTKRLKAYGCRVSLFMEPEPDYICSAADSGADRIEFYTGPYAWAYNEGPEKAISAYVPMAELAVSLGLGVNAGHDFNRENLAFWLQHIPQTEEVSIGHAIWSDALYFGMENTINLYRRICHQG